MRKSDSTYLSLTRFGLCRAVLAVEPRWRMHLNNGVRIRTSDRICPPASRNLGSESIRLRHFRRALLQSPISLILILLPIHRTLKARHPDRKNDEKNYRLYVIPRHRSRTPSPRQGEFALYKASKSAVLQLISGLL